MADYRDLVVGTGDASLEIWKFLLWALVLDSAKQDVTEWREEVRGLDIPSDPMSLPEISFVRNAMRERKTNHRFAITCDDRVKRITERHVAPELNLIARMKTNLTDIVEKAADDADRQWEYFNPIFEYCVIVDKMINYLFPFKEDLTWFAGRYAINTFWNRDLTKVIERSTNNIYERVLSKWPKNNCRSPPDTTTLRDAIYMIRNESRTWINEWYAKEQSKSNYIRKIKRKIVDVKKLTKELPQNYPDEFKASCSITYRTGGRKVVFV